MGSRLSPSHIQTFSTSICNYQFYKVLFCVNAVPMEFQTADAHGHGKTHEHEGPTVGHHASSVTEGEDEHHHEKNSVLKKVKAKARKIKDTLTKHGHGHRDHIPDDHDVDEEDDDEEELVEDPEVPGAPIYEATAIKTIGVVDSGVDTGRSTGMEVEPRLPNLNPDDRGKDVGKGNQRVNLGLTTVLGEISEAPQNTPASHTDPGNQDTRDSDPSRTFLYPEEEHSGQPKVNLQRPNGLVEDPGAPKDTAGAYVPGNCHTKDSYHIGKGGEEGGVSPAIQSFDKMEIYDEPKLNSGEKLSSPSGMGDFPTSVPTGSHDQFLPELAPPERMTTENHPQENTFGRSSNERDQFLPEIPPPRRRSAEDYPQENIVDRPSNQGSYSEKISSVTSAIADKAVSAKNAIASTLGYGDKHHGEGYETHVGDKSSMPESVTDYGKKMATAVTEKLTPVYESVAGAGCTVMSKMQGCTIRTGTGNTQARGVEEQDKGISAKDYFAEKLNPGEEDRALSEVISEALQKKKVNQEKPASTPRPVSDVISDALHKRKEEPDETDRPMGKVTESEEVARRLGTHENDSSKERNW